MMINTDLLRKAGLQPNWISLIMYCQAHPYLTLKDFIVRDSVPVTAHEITFDLKFDQLKVTSGE